MFESRRQRHPVGLGARLFRQRAWRRWVAKAKDDPDPRGTLDALGRRLAIADDQMPSWRAFADRLLHSLEVATAPLPDDKEAYRKYEPLDLFLRMECGAGLALTAIEDARSALTRLCAVLDPVQQRALKQTFRFAAVDVGQRLRRPRSGLRRRAP
jgi:hypothetical protein